MRKICWFLALVLLFGCFVGCQNSQELSLSQKNEIEKAWGKASIGGFPGWYDKDKNDPSGVICYGMDNGYVILMVNPIMDYCVLGKERIAGYKFAMPNRFYMYAYKNGEFYDLHSAYYEGYVSKEGIARAFEAHKEYICREFPGIAKIEGYDK